MSALNVVELTAIIKLAENELKNRKAKGEEVGVGNHNFDVTVRADGSLSRGESTKVSPQFSMDKFLKPLLLRYAASLDIEHAELVKKGERSPHDPLPSRAWLEAMVSVQGGLGAVIQLGAEGVLRLVDPSLVAIWDAAEKAAKAKFQEITPKADRAGNTVVVGNLETLANPSDFPESPKPKRGKK